MNISELSRSDTGLLKSPISKQIICCFNECTNWQCLVETSNYFLDNDIACMSVPNFSKMLCNYAPIKINYSSCALTHADGQMVTFNCLLLTIHVSLCSSPEDVLPIMQSDFKYLGLESFLCHLRPFGRLSYLYLVPKSLSDMVE